MRLGALEAGGTKMVCAIGNENGEIFERISIPTETPEITLPKLIEYFKDKEIEALGIGCFGPIDVNRNSETYGYITTTPKLAWANCDIVGAFKKALNIPVGFDTDVNGSALGEATWGITKGLENSVYITIGTGVGMGIMSNGKLLHGMLHPEARDPSSVRANLSSTSLRLQAQTERRLERAPRRDRGLPGLTTSPTNLTAESLPYNKVATTQNTS